MKGKQGMSLAIQEAEVDGSTGQVESAYFVLGENCLSLPDKHAFQKSLFHEGLQSFMGKESHKTTLSWQKSLALCYKDVSPNFNLCLNFIWVCECVGVERKSKRVNSTNAIPPSVPRH